jgi:putative MATE family efflux protein
VNAPPAEPPRFVTGSLWRHVIVMAGTGAIGLVAVFSVDLLNLFYISRLGQKPIAAAIGFAGVIGFFQTALCIGLTIGVGATVSRTIGAGRYPEARRLAGTSLAMMVAIAAAVGIGTILLLGPVLDALAAQGQTRALAASFLWISSPSLPLLAAGMCLSALLRSVGDARRALNVTLFAALATAALDPLFIFGLHFGLVGAAVSTVLSRVVMVGMGWQGAVLRHNLLARPVPKAMGGDLRRVFAVAGPAILTNLATPVGAAYVTRAMAAFGAAAVAGQASVDRISPVAFGIVYALTGAVGPILAQNLGAGRIERVREGLRDSLRIVVIVVLAGWLVLFAAQDLIVKAFSASGETAALVHLFCTWLAGSFLFTGSLFVANAAFNNLGFPLLSTAFNWGRATLGTIPLVMLGKAWGPAGVMVGASAGSLVFGPGAVFVAFRVIGRLDQRDAAQAHGGMAVSAGSGTAALASFLSRPSSQPTPAQSEPARAART